MSKWAQRLANIMTGSIYHVLFFFFFFWSTQVGYCQGISFVAGVLLLHMSEEQAFDMLKFLMYDLGIRQQYRPDMVSLQVSTWMGKLTTRTCYENMRVLFINKDTGWQQYMPVPTYTSSNRSDHCAGRRKGEVTPKCTFFLLPVLLFIHLDYFDVSCRVLEMVFVFYQI